MWKIPCEDLKRLWGSCGEDEPRAVAELDLVRHEVCLEVFSAPGGYGHGHDLSCGRVLVVDVGGGDGVSIIDSDDDDDDNDDDDENNDGDDDHDDSNDHMAVVVLLRSMQLVG